MDFLCFPKALNHVLAERGIHQLDVIAVAAALDLTVPASHAAIYPFASVSDDPRTWGVHPKGNEEALRELLAATGHRLRVAYISATTIPRDALSYLLSDNLVAGQSAIVGYRYASANNQFADLGHVGVVTSVGPGSDRIVLYEPESGNLEEMSSDALYGSMMIVDGGVWLVGGQDFVTVTGYPT